MIRQDTEHSTRATGLEALLDPGFVARLDGLDVATRRILRSRQQGERRSKRRGQGVEFADHRPYGLGDDLRFIDWNIYGRLDQLFLKLFQEDQDLTVHVAVDVSDSMGFGDPSKAVFARRLAAALGYVSLTHNNRLGVGLFAAGLQAHRSALRGRTQVAALVELLCSTPEGGPTGFDQTCKQMALARRGSGVQVVISDWFFKEGYDTGLKRLMSQNYDLYCVQVLSPQEIDPVLSGDLKLVDLEDADVAEVTISSALLKSYKRNLTAYCNDLRDFCTRHGATYVLVRTQDSIEKLVLSTFRRIGLLK